jgi:hypothetical protein
MRRKRRWREFNRERANSREAFPKNILMATCLKHGKESARVDGMPRVHQDCLGTAEKVAGLVKDRTAPVSLIRHWLGWGPMHHWTDRKIRIHAFYCMLGISLPQYVHKQAQTAWDGITEEHPIDGGLWSSWGVKRSFPFVRQAKKKGLPSRRSGRAAQRVMRC